MLAAMAVVAAAVLEDTEPTSSVNYQAVAHPPNHHLQRLRQRIIPLPSVLAEQKPQTEITHYSAQSHQRVAAEAHKTIKAVEQVVLAVVAISAVIMALVLEQQTKVTTVVGVQMTAAAAAAALGALEQMVV